MCEVILARQSDSESNFTDSVNKVKFEKWLLSERARFVKELQSALVSISGADKKEYQIQDLCKAFEITGKIRPVALTVSATLFE